MSSASGHSLFLGLLCYSGERSGDTLATRPPQEQLHDRPSAPAWEPFNPRSHTEKNTRHDNNCRNTRRSG